MTAHSRKITVVALLVPVMAAVVLRATFHPIPTADLWWYLATGRHIISTGAFPAENFFSYTAPHYAMVDHEWLPELIFYLLYVKGGFPWLYFFKSLMLLAAALVFFAAALRRGAPCAAAAMAVITAVSFAKGNLYFDIRPYIFTYLFLALFYLAVNEYLLRGSKKALMALPLLTWLWASCHGAFMLAFVIYGLFLLSLLLEYAGSRVRRQPLADARPAAPVAWAALASLALAFINPYGAKLLLYPFSFLGQSYYKTHLIEWIGPDLLHRDLPFLVYCIIFTAALVLHRRHFRLFDLLSCGLFGYMALTTVRHIPLFCLFSIPLLACLFQMAGGFLCRHGAGVAEKTAAFFRQPLLKSPPAICLSLVLLLLGYRNFSAIDYRHLSMEDALFPRYGMAFLERNRVEGPVFNPYEWGGYMLWRLYPGYRVFIDGRANTSYPEEVYRESLVAMFGDRGWREILDKYGINAVLCNKYHMDTDSRYRLPQHLEKSGLWTRIYEDRAEVLYVRNGERNRELIEKASKGRLDYPESPWQLRQKAMEMMQKDCMCEAASLLDRALALDDGFLQLYVDRAYTAMRTGDPGRAQRLLQKALSRDDTLYHAHDLLGRIYEQQGRPDRARSEYRRALRYNPGFTFSREALQRLESR